MSGRTQDERAALAEGKAMHAKAVAEKAKRVQRAVANVLDGTCDNCEDAARGQGVSVSAVRDAVRAARGGR